MSKLHSAKPSADNIEGVNIPPPLTKEELAERYQVGKRTIDNWIASRRIPYIKIGRLVRFRLADVEKALNKLTVKEVEL